MAVTVIQYPTSPNATGTNLVYTLSSSLATSPQYRYVTDIYLSGSFGSSDTYITTIKTYPNLHGSGIIDVARELEDQLSPDYDWKLPGIAAAPIKNVRTFKLRFGEEYGTSLSSSITTYTGSIDNLLKVFPGTVYKNQGSNNFDINPYIGTGSATLSNDPATVTDLGFPDRDYAILVNSTDYHTITLFQDLLGTPADINLNGGKLENGVFTFVRTINISLTSPSGSFDTIGIGPQNLADRDSAWATDIANGDINLVYSINDPGGFVMLINDKWDGQVFNGTSGNLYAPLTLKQCSDEYTRFAWINPYGFWDYYNVYTPLKRTSQVDRSLYERPFVRYEDSQGLYNISDRGNTQYKTDYTDNYQITTTWLDSPIAEWLSEMFDSQEVYIQKGTQFVPVNITNTTIQRNLNTSRNKLFQYTIDFKYANQRISR